MTHNKIIKGLPIGSSKRFNPGHYYSCPRLYGDPAQAIEGWSSVIATAANNGEITTTPALLGVQIRFGWAQLEPTAGDYATGISLIQTVLDNLKFAEIDGGWKKLSILIDTKTFAAGFHVVPAWMRDDPITGPYGGGQFDYSSGGASATGCIIRFNNVNVQERFRLLANALGAAFSLDTQIEMLSFPELNIPAMPTGAPVSIATAMAGHFAGGLVCLNYLATAFPYTIIRQISNYPRPDMSAIMPDYAISKLCIGGPDTLMDEVGLEVISNSTNKGIYPWLRVYKGNLPTAMEVQPIDYRFTNSTYRIDPANGWAASVTVSDAGGGNILLSSLTVDHGLSSTDMTGILNVFGSTNAVLNILTTAGGWTAGTNLTIVSVPNSKDIIISKAYTGQTAPTGMKQAPIGGYPITNQTYDPDTAKTTTGFIPTIQQLHNFLITEFNCNYIIWTRTSEINTLDGQTNNSRVRNWINNVAAKYGKTGGCNFIKPTSIT